MNEEKVMRARWVLSCAAGLAILAPTSASAYNWHTHSKMTETAVSILQAPPLALPPPGVSTLEWTQFTTSVAAAPGRLGLLRTGLPTELPDTRLFAPAGDSTAPIELWPFNDDEDTPENEAAQCKYYEDDNLDKIGSIQIKDFRYVPERTAAPCGLKQSLDEDLVLRRVLGWHAGSIDDHYNDTVMWFRPTNAGPASTVKKWLTKIWVAGAGGLALPFKCVWDAIFGDGCDVGSSFDMAKKYNPVEYVDGWIPGVGEVRQGDAATMWHFIHVDGDGAHYNDTRGLLYEEAGPSHPGAIDLMMMAGADLTGLSLKAGASDGDDFYGEYDKISRGDPAWQAYSVGHLEFSPVDNLAQFGWDKRYVAGGKISAAGLAWPLHAIGDAAAPHHVVGTSSWGHRPFEDFVDQNLDFMLPAPSEQKKRDILGVAFIYWQGLRAGASVQDVVRALAVQTRGTAKLFADWPFDDSRSIGYLIGDKQSTIDKYANDAPRAKLLIEEGLAATLAFLVHASEKALDPGFDPKTKCAWPTHYVPFEGCTQGPLPPGSGADPAPVCPANQTCAGVPTCPNPCQTKDDCSSNYDCHFGCCIGIVK